MPENGLLDASTYTDVEMAGTVRALGPWWALLVGEHDRASVAPMATEQAALLAALIGPDAADLIGPGSDPFHAVVQLSVELEHRAVPRDQLDPVIEASLDLIQQAGRALAAAGEFQSAVGRVHGLFTSDGSVPKLPVDRVEIGPRGLTGDNQRTRRHHGRPWQALCLWSKEQVDHLAAEGHPITYGSAGENISIVGIDWTLAEVGTRMRIGPDVIAELAPYALPCAKNAQWFLDGNFNRMHHERDTGISRIYASVLAGGTVQIGDEVVLEP